MRYPRFGAEKVLKIGHTLEMTSNQTAFLLFSIPNNPRCEGRLLAKSAVGGEIDDGEYLGAAMRLTAELSRYAITQVTSQEGKEKDASVAGE